MNGPSLDRRHALALAGVAWAGSATGALAQHAGGVPPTSAGHVKAGTHHPPPLPQDRTTHHTLQLPGRMLKFSATAGSIRITGAKQAPLADIAFIAYQRDGTHRARRPVTFVFNGGPGFASAWLQVGAAGPWRIPLDANYPSASPLPLPNADTWLDFTDLVFVDPAGTGYSRVLASGEEAKHLWSVHGDIASLSQMIRRWLDRFDRMVSPKYILGESYGGFRGPLLAHELAEHNGAGVAGLVLVSPALEIKQRSAAFDPFYYVTLLPSMTASACARHGSVTRAQLADVEEYAATEYLVDVTRGVNDAAAVDRRSARVAALTGLDPALVRHHRGLIDVELFVRELDRRRGLLASPYDATMTGGNPFPMEESNSQPDPLLATLQAPVSSAMQAIYATKLQWRPQSLYRLFNPAAARQWEWGSRFGSLPQSVTALRTALALDNHLRVLIAQGMFDLVVPYFFNLLILGQIPDSVGLDRVHFTLHPGGHMIYTDDAARAALHDEAAAMMMRGG